MYCHFDRGGSMRQSKLSASPSPVIRHRSNPLATHTAPCASFLSVWYGLQSNVIRSLDQSSVICSSILGSSEDNDCVLIGKRAFQPDRFRHLRKAKKVWHEARR